MIAHAIQELYLRSVFPNLFSTTAHFLWTAHQTAHCINDTYFTCI